MFESPKIYLDYAATTPVDEAVIAAMLPYFSGAFGNPSSVHFYGQQAEAAIENARLQTARALNARSDEIIFTSCGTESDNLALRGTALMQRKKRGANHILVSPVEHHAVLHTVQQLQDVYGFEVELLPVDKFGLVDPDDLRHFLRSDTAVVSVIYANNEIGSVNPVQELGKLCRQAGVPFHTDAVQAAAYLPMDVRSDSVDLLALGAHKFYGPKGIGALFVRKDLAIYPAQTGGKQEWGMRAGTQNVPYIVGLGEALQHAQSRRADFTAHYIAMRDHLIGRVLEEIPAARLTGHPTQRLPNHASFVFDGADGNALLVLLDNAGFACSSGSACKVGNPQPSEVLMAIGLSRSWSLGSLRVTLGRSTTPDDIDQFCQALPALVEKAREL